MFSSVMRAWRGQLLASGHSALRIQAATMASKTAKLLARARRMKGLMKRGARGLYGGKMVQFGNRVSFAENKSRRKWKPNVQQKRFWSETYNRFLQFKVTTSVIKEVKRLAHGIDEYLMRTPIELLRYPKAINIRKRLLRVHKKRPPEENFLPLDPESTSKLAPYRPAPELHISSAKA